MAWAVENSLDMDGFSDAWARGLAFEQHSRHGCRYHQLHENSINAASFVPDKSIDCVFVDGLHTYEGVASDILAWLPKLKRPGGSFVFNDVSSEHFLGVDRAVFFFC